MLVFHSTPTTHAAPQYVCTQACEGGKAGQHQRSSSYALQCTMCDQPETLLMPHHHPTLIPVLPGVEMVG